MRASCVCVAVVLYFLPHAPAAEPVIDPSEAGPAFRYVGEYVGTIFVHKQGVWRSTPIGLQVVARGNGRFEGIEYLGGLPGAGWNRKDRAVLPGSMADGYVTLEAVPVDVRVDGFAARVGETGQPPVHGSLRRINRASPTLGMTPPPEAKRLFVDGSARGLENATITEAGLLAQGFETSESYSDFTLHLEFRVPFMPDKANQSRGNSGVYLQRRYEVQILDSFGSEARENGAGALYRTKPAALNMALPPLVWQTYDIRFHPAEFQGDTKTAPARFTVWHNGVKIHDDVDIPHKTGNGKPEGPQSLPTLFQDHHDPVRFRNIWIVDHTEHPTVRATPRIVAAEP